MLYIITVLCIISPAEQFYVLFDDVIEQTPLRSDRNLFLPEARVDKGNAKNEHGLRPALSHERADLYRIHNGSQGRRNTGGVVCRRVSDSQPLATAAAPYA